VKKDPTNDNNGNGLHTHYHKNALCEFSQNSAKL